MFFLKESKKGRQKIANKHDCKNNLEKAKYPYKTKHKTLIGCKKIYKIIKTTKYLTKSL